MAKKFPTPEEYGHRLADRKRKADRLPEVLKKLDLIAVELAGQAETLTKLPLDELHVTLEILRGRLVDPAQLSEITKVLLAIQELQAGLIDGMGALSEGVKALEFPAPESPRDYRPEFERLMREISGFQPSSPRPTPRPVAPVAYEFDHITRDENGDITGARVVPVTRH